MKMFKCEHEFYVPHNRVKQLLHGSKSKQIIQICFLFSTKINNNNNKNIR